MMIKTVSAAIAFAAIATSVAATETSNMPAGWRDVDITEETSEYVAKTLSQKTVYPVGVKPLCLREVKKVKAQIVSTTSMNFDVTFIGCEMETQNGWCPANGPCTTKFFQAKVFEQNLTNTLKLDELKEVPAFQ